MPKLNIDGKEIETEDGLNLIEAAAREGIDIPHFCYHPSLSVVAQCRQCLVEIEGVPKVMPACNTYVRDGLIVKTNSEKALKARKATVEFTLINHPLDCPICDKGGECPLQLTTVKHGPGYSRFEGPEEKKVRKKYYLSDRILYDPNRCIMCTRCVRFTDEVTKTGELGYQGRGFRKRIAVFPDRNLDNELAGNVTDLCPVGALLNKENLHEERVWYWKFTDSVCSLCSNGCNITVGVDPRKGKVSRIRPRINMDVNEYWICDRGRYDFREVQKEEGRLKDPIIRLETGHEITDWEWAVDVAVKGLIAARDEPLKTTAVIGSARLTNEELYLLKKIGKELKTGNIASSAGIINELKKFGIISTDPYPNSTGVKELGIAYGYKPIMDIVKDLMSDRISALYVAGIDLFDHVPAEEHEKLREALSGLSLVIAQDVRINETVRLASVILPGATPYEKDGTFTNDRGRVQRINQAIEPPGTAKQDWEILSLIGGGLRKEAFNYESASEVLEEMAEFNSFFSGLSYERIGMLGASASA